MCGGPDQNAPPPPPKAPPVLEQIAPKSAKDKTSTKTKKNAKGLSRYKTDSDKGKSSTSKLGGISTKTGTGS